MLAIMIAAATNITAKGSNMAFGVDTTIHQRVAAQVWASNLNMSCLRICALLRNLSIHSQPTIAATSPM